MNLGIDALLDMGQTHSCDTMTPDFWRAYDGSFPTGLIRNLSIDVLTGYDCDTQARRSDRYFVAPKRTVTFHCHKPGDVTWDAAKVCGKPVVKDMGLWSLHLA